MARDEERVALQEELALRMLWKGAPGDEAKICHVHLCMDKLVWVALKKHKLPAFKELQAGAAPRKLSN